MNFESSSDLIQRAREAALGIGVELRDSVPHGESRHPGAGKRRNNKATAVRRDDSVILIFDHSTGQTAVASINDTRQVLSGQKRKQIEFRRQEQERAERHRRDQAIIECRHVWANAQSCINHTYLQRKRIKPHCAKIDGRTGALLVPVINTSGKLQSLQRIFPNGDKRCWPGAPLKAGFCPISKVSESKKFLIAEGFATAATLHEETGYPVAAAMFASNLKPAAIAPRAKFPGAKIVICGDDDRFTKGNPGKTKAIEAARAIGATWDTPPFPENSLGTDYNDYFSMKSGGAA